MYWQWIPTGIASVLFMYHVSAHPLTDTSILVTTSTTNVSLPEGATNHGDPNLICTPASWFTVASFILGNYVAHAATTQTFPGEKLGQQVLALMTSLLFPGAGAVRGLNNIVRGFLVLAKRGDTELQQAAAAGALCMVIRTEDWTPLSQYSLHGVKKIRPVNQRVRSWKMYRPSCLRPTRVCPGWQLVDTSLEPNGSFDTFEMFRDIHGALKKLPKGYAYASVPPEAIVTSNVPEATIHLAKSLDTSKIIVSLFQSIYSNYTLYKARGDQIQRFGYAAFSLTVAPYAVMSVINLLGGLLLPVYPTLFLVQSEVSIEVEHRYGKWFDGTVGMLESLHDDDPTTFVMQELEQDDEKTPFMMHDQISQHKDSMVVLGSKAASDNDSEVLIPVCPPLQCKPEIPDRVRERQYVKRDVIQQVMTMYDNSILMFLSIFFVAALPVGIIAGLSGFEAGGSTHAQRVWLMTWLAFGAIYGGVFPLYRFDVAEEDSSDENLYWFTTVFTRLVLAAPAIGGIVVVAQMIVAYGDCGRLS